VAVENAMAAKKHAKVVRVCFVIEATTDVRLVEGLAELGHLTLLARQIEGQGEISQPTAVDFEAIRASLSRIRFPFFVLSHLLRRKSRSDFVLVQGYGLAAAAANVAGRMTGTPTAMLVCSPTEKYYRCRLATMGDGRTFATAPLIALKLLARFNALVGRQYLVLSQHLSEVVSSHGTHRPITLLPLYGVDTTVFSPAREDKSAIRAELHLPTNGFLIFFSSRIAPEKDSDTLLEAVRTLLDEGRELWLVHCSGGFREFQQAASGAGVSHRVIAREAVHPHHELPRYYQASDVCVQSSKEEGLGFSALEALACEIPVIAAATGGLIETILPGKTGWTYPVGDATQLARCLIAVLENPAEAKRRAAAGRLLVCERFERTLVFEQLRSLVQTSLPQSAAV
jgi:glycosyltransferase involved in cell wall biosynthesis